MRQDSHCVTFRLAAQRNPNPDFRPATGLTRDVESSANGAHALFDAEEAEALPGNRRLAHEAAAIVGDHELERVGAYHQRYADALRIGVAGYVVQRFLCDAIERDVESLRQRSWRSAHAEIRLDRVPVREFLAIRLQRLRQADVLDDARMQFVREPAQRLGDAGDAVLCAIYLGAHVGCSVARELP